MQGQGNVYVSLGIGLLLAWTPAAAVLFSVFGRRNGTLATVIGGYLLLPPTIAVWSWRGHALFFGKQGAIGLAVMVALLIWDARTLFRFRPRPLDVPALGMVCWALMETVFGEYVEWEVAVSVLGQRVWWFAPYLAARLYFGDADGARRIAVGIVVGSLGLVPVVGFEALMGPSWYLRALLYKMPAHEGMVERLGFWRPEAFFSHGIELSSWLALATVLAVWLWVGRVWKPPRGPAWGPALVLATAVAATVTVYGYIDLAIGILVVAITFRLRTRAAIVALALLAPLYIGLRVSGTWEGKALAAFAGKTGRASTVAVRLDAETRMIDAVLEHNPAFGYGRPLGLSWADAEKEAEKKSAYVPGGDGGWLVFLWAGGLVGLSTWLVAMQLWPVGLALIEPWERPDADEVGTPLWGLALFLALGTFDCLHNNPSFTPMALAAGSIVGATLGGRAKREWKALPREADVSRGASKPSRGPVVKVEVERHLGRDAARLALVLAVLAVPDMLGYLNGKGTGPRPARPVAALPPPPLPQTESQSADPIP